ncbi:flavin reductase family protein [Actinomycetes bacterium M1A6_2h]
MTKKPPPTPEQIAFRTCLGTFPTGVTVITYDTPEGPRGATVNSFVSVSLDPALILISIATTARARDGLENSSFTVNVLGAHQSDLAMHFAGRPSDTLRVPWQHEAEVPRLRECAAWLECAPWRSVHAGDHVLFIGEVVAYGHHAADPLIFHAGAFRHDKIAPPQWRPASPLDGLDRRRDLERWSDTGSTTHIVPA